MHASTLRSLSDCFTTSANLQAGTQHNPGVLMIKHERNTPQKRDFAPGASCGQNSTLGLNNRGFLPNFKVASPEQSRVMSCIPAVGGSDHMLRELNLLPYSAHPFHIQRELCTGCATGVWFGSCVIAHDQSGAHLAELCSRFAWG